MVEKPVEWMVHLVRATRARFSNPTRGWPPCAVSRLEYDMRLRRLNGIPFEAPIGAAKVFGRTHLFSGGDERLDLDYRKLGLQIGCYEGAITSFRAVLRPENRRSARDRGFRAADLTLIGLNGSRCRLWGNTTEEDLVALLGSPIATLPIGAERVHTFVVERNHIESYHDAITGLLLDIDLHPATQSAMPLIAAPEDEGLERSA